MKIKSKDCSYLILMFLFYNAIQQNLLNEICFVKLTEIYITVEGTENWLLVQEG